jgi:hypothetical protein
LLLRKVNQFVRELLWNDGFATARNSTPFRDLDAQIGTFILTFPPCLRDPLTPPKSKFRKTMNHDLMVSGPDDDPHRPNADLTCITLFQVAQMVRGTSENR